MLWCCNCEIYTAIFSCSLQWGGWESLPEIRTPKSSGTRLAHGRLRPGANLQTLLSYHGLLGSAGMSDSARRILVRTSMAFACLGAACCVPFLALVMSLIGSFLTIGSSIILPVAIYAKIFQASNSTVSKSQDQSQCWDKISFFMITHMHEPGKCICLLEVWQMSGIEFYEQKILEKRQWITWLSALCSFYTGLQQSSPCRRFQAIWSTLECITWGKVNRNDQKGLKGQVGKRVCCKPHAWSFLWSSIVFQGRLSRSQVTWNSFVLAIGAACAISGTASSVDGYPQTSISMIDEQLAKAFFSLNDHFMNA